MDYAKPRLTDAVSPKQCHEHVLKSSANTTRGHQTVHTNVNIAFIGLGIMGCPMALNLIKAGHRLRVHARRADAMQALIGASATGHSSPAEAARNSDVIFIMVSDTPDVEQVVLGCHGVIEGAAKGAVVVDMSTISPLATRMIAKKLAASGIDMLDAPVSGGDIGAGQGTLSIMVGGKAVVFARVKPLFDVLGNNVVHIGDTGAGQVAKCCNQIVAGVTIEAVAEAMTLARKNGADPVKVRDALMGGFANSRVLEVHGKRMLDRSFQPGFKARLHRKDLRIVMETAAQVNVSLQQAGLVAQHLNALMGRGLGEEDSSALVKVIERASGLETER